MTNKEKLSEMILKKPTISLKEGEVCFYEGAAAAYKVKNVVTGYKRAGSGFSIRVAKGFSIRTGSGKSTAVRENISEEYAGTFYITNKRLILLTSKYGFEIKIQNLLSIKQYNDGLEFFCNEKSYLMKSYDIKRILEIINLMDNAYNNPDGLFTEEKVDDETIKQEDKNYTENAKENAKKAWTEMTTEEKWKRIGIIALIVFGIIFLSVFGE